jgi:hypothetical protein
MDRSSRRVWAESSPGNGARSYIVKPVDSERFLEPPAHFCLYGCVLNRPVG